MSENNDAWLGLLKWSLNYVDGTVPSAESPGYTQMSPEDKAFLEDVMKNGIIDEGERMKTILSSLVKYLDSLLKADISEDTSDGSNEKDEILDLLEELQDIVEQIDFAKSFAAMGGIKFLIGCSGEKQRVPKDIRRGCLAVLSTLCQNNPPVQYMMLEQGSIVKLVELYFAEFPPFCSQTGSKEKEKLESISTQDETLRTKIMQCLSSSIRNHDVAEKIFCMNVEGVKMIESGLGLLSENESLPYPCETLQLKTLFFLQALVTSDLSDNDRIEVFKKSIRYCASTFLKVEKSQEIREMTLSMLVRLMDKSLAENCFENMESTLLECGRIRRNSIMGLNTEEQVFFQEESKLWQCLMRKIDQMSSAE